MTFEAVLNPKVLSSVELKIIINEENPIYNVSLNSCEFENEKIDLVLRRQDGNYEIYYQENINPGNYRLVIDFTDYEENII